MICKVPCPAPSPPPAPSPSPPPPSPPPPPPPPPRLSPPPSVPTRRLLRWPPPRRRHHRPRRGSGVRPGCPRRVLTRWRSARGGLPVQCEPQPLPPSSKAAADNCDFSEATQLAPKTKVVANQRAAQPVRSGGGRHRRAVLCLLPSEPLPEWAAGHGQPAGNSSSAVAGATALTIGTAPQFWSPATIEATYSATVGTKLVFGTLRTTTSTSCRRRKHTTPATSAERRSSPPGTTAAAAEVTCCPTCTKRW